MDGSSSFNKVPVAVPDLCAGLSTDHRHELQKLLEVAMRAGKPFQILRREVYDWMKAQGHVLSGVDRHNSNLIVMYYLGGMGSLLVYSQPELAEYIKSQPVSTW